MQRLLAITRSIERLAIVAIFLAMVALFFFNVLMREFGGTYASNFDWIEEAVRILNIYLVFLAAGLALERGRQVNVGTWRARIGSVTRLPIEKIIDLAGLAFSIYVVRLSWGMAQFVKMTGEHSPTLGISVSWYYVAPMIGFSLLGLRYLLRLVGLMPRRELDAGEIE